LGPFSGDYKVVQASLQAREVLVRNEKAAGVTTSGFRFGSNRVQTPALA
jgi:hypothetical protein